MLCFTELILLTYNIMCKAWGWRDFLAALALSVTCYLSLGFSSKVSSVHVHSLG